jgi:hypothetical protein
MWTLVAPLEHPDQLLRDLGVQYDRDLSITLAFHIVATQ